MYALVAFKQRVKVTFKVYCQRKRFPVQGSCAERGLCLQRVFSWDLVKESPTATESLIATPLATLDLARQTASAHTLRSKLVTALPPSQDEEARGQQGGFPSHPWSSVETECLASGTACFTSQGHPVPGSRGTGHIRAASD